MIVIDNDHDQGSGQRKKRQIKMTHRAVSGERSSYYNKFYRGETKAMQRMKKL